MVTVAASVAGLQGEGDPAAAPNLGGHGGDGERFRLCVATCYAGPRLASVFEKFSLQNLTRCDSSATF